jgi:hypothetical protein
MNGRAVSRHAAAGHRWLIDRMREDGAWRDLPDAGVDAYYKAPWGFAAAGDAEPANLVLDYIERRFLLPSGDLVPVTGEKLMRRYPLIPMAHVAIGATLVGRVELADQLLGLLDQHRHRELGGWGDRREAPGLQRLDAVSTACIGLAFLEAGRLAEARAAAGFLERLLGAQPDIETEFYTTMLASGELLTQFPDAETGVDRRVIHTNRYQVWHAIGFPIMLFGRLYETDGDSRWRDLADTFVGMLDRSRQAWFDLAGGKAAWGSAVMYRATGDRGYRRRAMRNVRGLVSFQDADGSWLSCLGGDGGTARQATSLGYEVSTELPFWLALVGRTIAERDGVRWIPPSEVRPGGIGEVARRVGRLTAHQRRILPRLWPRARARARRALTRIR